MITLAVAEQLKDEEFPYLITTAYYDTDGKVKTVSQTTATTLTEIEQQHVPVVTVNDLLWAIGDEFYGLGQPNIGEWEAVERSIPRVSGKGTTPEDALAQLWCGMKHKAELIAKG